MQANILVTGATGFIGAHLIEHLLSKGEKIRALKRENSRMDLVSDIADQIDWAIGDTNDIVSLESAMQGIEKIYHCAAIVSFHPKDHKRMFHINEEGTANIVNVALSSNVRRLIYVSSVAALGRAKDRPHLTSDSKWIESSLNTQYAISKYRGEMEAWRGQAEGLEVSVIYPTMVFGSGFWNENTARFFCQVRDGLKFWPPGNSGFVDVRDVARFMQLLMDAQESGGRYLLCAENFSFKALFEKIAAAIGGKAPFIKVSPLLAEVAWRVEWLKEKLLGATPMVTKESARMSVVSFTYDGSKATKDFDFKYIPIDETIKTMGRLFSVDKKSPKPVRMPKRGLEV